MWQPIETAPKDGTTIDLWVVWSDDPSGERIPDAHWGISTRIFEDEELEGWVGKYIGVDGCEALISEEQRATHWMPLPAPPTVVADQAKVIPDSFRVRSMVK